MISVAIFGMTTSDISKLLLVYVISRSVRRVKFETILKYHEWYLCQISRTNHAIICLYYCPQKIGSFHMYSAACRYFKLSWNTTAPKLNRSVRSNRKSFEKTGPPFEVDHFFLPLHQHGRCDVTCKPAINCTSPIPTNTVRLLHSAPSLDPSS